MSCAYTWHKQSRARTAQASAFQALEKEVASLKEGQEKLKEEKERLAAHWRRQESAYKESLRVAQNAREEANKRLHEVAQAQAELLNEVVLFAQKLLILKRPRKPPKPTRRNLRITV